MAHCQHPAARVAVRCGVARELLEVVTAELQAGLLPEAARRGVEQVFVREDETAAAPPPGERRGVTTNQQRAQLCVAHRQDHKVNGDGKEVSTHL